MPWVRLDDGFAEHPKILGLSDSAFRAHVAALCYCNRNLTDGRVPAAFTNGQASELVAAGVWESDGQWFVIHDYADYQPTGDETERIRELRREAGRRGGLASGQKRREANEAKASAGKQTKQKQSKLPSKELATSLEIEANEAKGQAKSNPVPVPEPNTEPEPLRSEAKASSRGKAAVKRSEYEQGWFRSLWEVLAEEGIKAPSGANASARSAFTQLVWGMVDEEIDPDSVRTACDYYREHETLGKTMLTLPSLTKWWGTLFATGNPLSGADRLRAAMAERGVE